MEFGRKGDAKKAMKLHHREGITLKQAWRRVKGGKTTKSKKSKKSGMSPKKKKAVSNAKKAMRLHHREGITLKQAWKKINKFGDTVCPKGYEMNPKWNGRRIDHQCIKECGFLQTRDPVTNRCKGPLGGRGPASPLRAARPRAPPVIKPGYEINPATGRLRKMCLPGQYRDPVTGRCRNIRMSDAARYRADTMRGMGGDADFISPGGLRMDTMDFGGIMYNPEMKHCNTFGSTTNVAAATRAMQMKFNPSMMGKKHYRSSFGTCAVCNAR